MYKQKITFTKIIIVMITLVFSTIVFSGCEELDDSDYITVTVDCTVQVSVMDYSTLKMIENALVRVEIIKAGGEKVSELVSTNDLGMGVQTIKGTFQLYREQPITCVANVVLTSVEQYSDFTFNSAVYTISWSEIYPAYNFGDSVTRYVNLFIKGVRTES